MKDSQSVIVVSALMAFVGIRLYQKYFRKDKGQAGQSQKKDTTFSSSAKEDDYEPYSKK